MSLLESLVVLAILGLIGTLAYPNMDRAYHATVQRQGINLLVQDLRRARAAALRGAAVTVAPAVDGQGYVMPGGWRRDLPAGLVVSGAGIVFFSDGASSGGTWAVGGGQWPLAVAVTNTGSVAMVRP